VGPWNAVLKLSKSSLVLGTNWGQHYNLSRHPLKSETIHLGPGHSKEAPYPFLNLSLVAMPTGDGMPVPKHDSCSLLPSNDFLILYSMQEVSQMVQRSLELLPV
jgi:hypothetical protein